MAEQLAQVIQFPIGGVRTPEADIVAEQVVQNDLLEDLKPGKANLYLLACMDDRGPHERDTVLRGTRYIQDAAGMYGLGHDWAVGMEMEKPGLFASDGRHVDVLSNIIFKLLQPRGYFGAIHEECAAHGSGGKIAKFTRDTDTAIFNRARAYDPELTYLRYDRAATATGMILDAGLIAPPNESKQRMVEDTPEHPAIPSAQLEHKDHAAVAFLAIHRAKKALDVERASDMNLGMYATSMGDLRQIHGIVSSLIPLKWENFAAATAARHATIGQKVLLGADGQPLPILQVPEAQAA